MSGSFYSPNVSFASSQFQTSSPQVSRHESSFNGAQSSGMMTHSQSSYDLGRSQKPAFAQERKYVPSHLQMMRSSNRNAASSSFSGTSSTSGAGNSAGSTPTADRTLDTRTGGSLRRQPSLVRDIVPNDLSLSSNTKSAFGGVGFGSPKPLNYGSDSNEVDDLPPMRTIYNYHSKKPSSRTLNGSTSNGGIPRSNTFLRKSVLNNNANKSRADLSTLTSPEKSLAESGDEYRYQSIIVYGFPNSATQAVLAHFKAFGQFLENLDIDSENPNESKQYQLKGLLRKQIESGSAGDGESDTTFTPLLLRKQTRPLYTGKDWIRLTYTDPTAAARAYEEDGKMVGGYRIGVAMEGSTTDKCFEGPTKAESVFNPQYLKLDEFSALYDRADYSNFSMSNTTFGGADMSRADSRLPRTTSMPVLGKRMVIKDANSAFEKRGDKKVKPLRYAPSMANIQEKDKRSKGWLAWTTKKASELVFGWDDL